MSKTVTKLRQVYDLASKMFPCHVSRLDDVHGRGAMGIRMIVGRKVNISFSPEANPNRPGLTRDEVAVEKFKASRSVPDVRILWIPAGTTEAELVKGWLLPIKESLTKKEPIVEPTISHMATRRELSDVEIAARLEKGDEIGFDKSQDDDDNEIGEDFDDDFDNSSEDDVLEESGEADDDEGFGTEVDEDVNVKASRPSREKEENDDIPAWAATLVENQQSIVKSLKEMNSEITAQGKKIKKLESKKRK